MTDDPTSKASVEIELNAENLAQALRELLAHWRDRAQERFSADSTVPDERLVRLHVIAHAAAVATYLEDDEVLRKLGSAAEGYFNDPRVTGGGRQDDTWFPTRARAVDALLDEIEQHTAQAVADGRLSMDAPPNIRNVAAEVVDVVVQNLSRLELALAVPDLPSDFRDAQHRADAIANATSSIVKKLGSGEAIGAIPVLESIMRGLGHPAPTNLTSAARKR